MKKMGATTAVIVAFVYAMMLLARNPVVMAVSGSITTDLPVYPIWGVGGTVVVRVGNLAPNVTYYLWLQKPRQPVPAPLPLHFTTVNAGTQPPIALTISPQDPAGTYTLTISTSASIDTATAAAHFGVSGTNSQIYERTTTVTVAGGGFAVNSTVIISVRLGNRTFPDFPVNVTADRGGNYQYSFKLAASAPTGSVRASVTGRSFDGQPLVSANSNFTVQFAPVTVAATNTPPNSIQRTGTVNATYTLSYPDGSPVTSVNGTVTILAGATTVTAVPLKVINATTGEWEATWIPPPYTNTTVPYDFTVTPTNLIDPYGNRGQGAAVTSKSFKVLPATLLPTVRMNATIQRTDDASVTITALYLNGAAVENVTQAAVSITQPDGSKTKLPVTLAPSQAEASVKIPVNATLGNWTMQYTFQDTWGNSAAGKLALHVVPASPVFQLNTPANTQRTTLLNVTTRISYPDRTLWNKTITMTISYGNQTVTPVLSFNSTSLEWSGSYYLVQNATLGPYNVTWTAVDSYGNGGTVNSTTLVVPAEFKFYLRSNNSTIAASANLDLPVKVTYPNGTLLPDTFGNVSFANVTASYQNSTGYIFTLPLAYNATNGTWHMYFSPSAQGNFTFSFTANDRFGNMGMAADAYVLKVNPSARVLSQNLILAGVVGALVPAAILVWAIIAISTRRRKHKP